MTLPRAGIPLSSAQHRLWFLHKLDPADPAYNVSMAIEVRGPLNPASMAQAAAAVAMRHPARRTVFRSVRGRPFQRHAMRPPRMCLVALGRRADAEDEDGLVERLLQQAAALPFDLAAAPPVRWILVRCAPDRHVLLLVVHHIVFDGGSLRVTAADLESLYARFRD